MSSSNGSSTKSDSTYSPLLTAQLKALYTVIFSVVALAVIRPSFLGKTFNLTDQEMKRTELIELFLNGIESARDDGDFFKESMLFDRMIDVLRDPNLLKEMMKIEGKISD